MTLYLGYTLLQIGNKGLYMSNRYQSLIGNCNWVKQTYEIDQSIFFKLKTEIRTRYATKVDKVPFFPLKSFYNVFRKLNPIYIFLKLLVYSL